MKISSLFSGLVGYWPLDQQSFDPNSNRFTDKSAYCNHGTGHGTQLGGSPTFQADHMGQLLRAAPFNGTDDVIIIPNHSSLNITGTITISFWLRPDVRTSPSCMIIQRQLTYVRIDNTNLRLRHAGAGDGTTIINDIVDDAVWQHFICISDGANTSIYKNGAYVGGEAAIGNLTGGGTLSYIGRNNVVAEFTDGSLAEIRVYNRSLNSDERTLLYESYRPKVLI